MTVMVNAWLTDSQRNWLMDEYLNKLSVVDMSLIEEAHDQLIHMRNHQFYAECKEFMPTCMQELRDAGIR
jgi:DNA-directed RNA polymerase subunit F